MLAGKLDREESAGQLFCTSHTTLAYDRSISEIFHNIEEGMGMANIFSGFLVDVDLNDKTYNVVSWMLNLFGPDNIQKSWNYYSDFMTHLKRSNRTAHLFHLKDARYGSLSKSCAVVCYHWHDFIDFLDSHDYVTNRLACLVRDAMNLEYIKVIISVIAVLGIQVISPFHARTVCNSATPKPSLPRLYDAG